MDNTFIGILKKRLLENMVFVTYKVKEGLYYNKFFLKADNNDFYNSQNDSFYLKCHIKNQLETIKASDIIKFESLDEKSDDRGRINFIKKSENMKLDYENYSQLPRTFDNFDELFFREDYTSFHKQLIFVFGKTIPVENLIKDLKDGIKLNKGELDHCKMFWSKAHEERWKEIIGVIEGEIKDSDLSKDDDLTKELKMIREEYNNCMREYIEKINSFESLKQLTEYWHPLLLPAPSHLRF